MPYLQQFGVSRISPLNMSSPLNKWWGGEEESQASSDDPASTVVNNNNAKATKEKGGRSWLDWTQDALTVAGMVPGFGAVPDLLNTAISGGRAVFADNPEDRKKYMGDMALNLAASVPGAGLAAGATKLGKSVKAIDTAYAGTKAVKNIKKLDKALGVIDPITKKTLTAQKAGKYGIKSTKLKDSTDKEVDLYYARKRDTDSKKPGVQFIRDNSEVVAGGPENKNKSYRTFI
jgi:hypothetical protein|tara:strand:- start:320 stop:1015 length:696 start_codon:yes stop_codon:yes gene_type:complete